MRSHGWISLIFKGEVISNRPYYCINRRKEIMRDWEKLYGQKYYECFIQVNPNTDETAIKENGMNIKYPKGIKRKSFDPYLKMRA